MQQWIKLSVVFVVGISLGGASSFVINPDFLFEEQKIVRVPKLTFADGSYYEGSLDANGLMHGQGTLYYGDGSQYKGEFVAGLAQGHGVVNDSMGNTHSGEFVAGLPHGKAKIEYYNGSTYEGLVNKGVITGFGTLVNEQYTYHGEMEKDLFSGEGKITYVNGNEYQGTFLKGQYHGTGRFTTTNHEVYTGDFINNTFTGKGGYTDAHGNSFLGDFEQWTLNGEGVRKDGKGNIWKGNFDYGSLNGPGEFLGEEAEFYQGNFDNDEFEGLGKYTDSEGNVYEGEFSYGQKHGKGTIIYKEAIDGLVKVTGRWRYDELVETDDFDLFSAEQITEHALLNQSKLLEKRLNSLVASSPDKTDIYFLGIAGYGREEVFRREVRYIDKKLNTLLDLEKRSVLLINSRRSIENNPLATRNSIKKSISAIANKMNKQQDLLFVYVTSHGSEGHELSLSQVGLSLANLPADELALVLKESGIKHKVIIVSACYSGGFIPPLKEDSNLVITAAAADRTSFGCADDNQFTYFGRAFFKESFQADTSLVNMFDNSKNLISQWEKTSQYKASKPQIYYTQDMLDYLKKIGL